VSDDFTFLPWARQGLANRINAAGPLRATVPVELQLSVRQLDGTERLQDLQVQNVQLYGPGDVLGFEARAVIRTEPRDSITNFEPNYLACIEFYDEDFPWRYTPSSPAAGRSRLSPWIALIVLKEEEFEEGVNIQNRPLPYITIKDDALQSAFPDPADLWAWAHIHVNRGLTANADEIVATDSDAVATRLGATVNENADLAYSRLICPRRLTANTTYHAFVLPTFESGRLAGLGLDPSQTPDANASAWTSNVVERANYPVYYRWHFRTGENGDFEQLVRLLQPRRVDRRVGVREMDVQEPGSNIPGLTDPALQGVLHLGGALRVPRNRLSAGERTIVERQENWAQPHPHPFQTGLAALINLADSYTQQTAAQANAATGLVGVSDDPDPLITPPLYGRWHAMTSRLLVDRNGRALANTRNWVHELNLDPRFRVSAACGTRVVQSKQEDLMAAVWEQIGDVLEANRRMRQLKFAQQAALVWHEAHLKRLATTNPGKALALTTPVHERVIAGEVNGGMTLSAHIARSKVPPVLLGTSVRRVTRPRSRLMRELHFDERFQPEDLIARVNAGQVVPSPPKITPPGVVTIADLAAGTLPRIPPWLIYLLRNAPWIVFLPLIVALIISLVLWLLGFGVAGGLTAIVIGAVLVTALASLLNRIHKADALLEDQIPEAVNQLPRSPDFTFTPARPPFSSVTRRRTGPDSTEAVRFKSALKDLHALTRATLASDPIGENGPPRMPLDLDNDIGITLESIDPKITIPRRAISVIRVPPRIRVEQPEVFVEAMAYPVFDIPMYRPLAELSSELLIPNLNLIPNNSITLLETNQKFIEAYMVGLNHEFARELLWREYPTDQRGTYFRQFWDVSSFFAGPGGDPALRERLRDIPPLDKWSINSELGEHDSRERPGDAEEELVLVIRGELLKRYPNSVIYAQRAEWARQPNGRIDRNKERLLIELAAAEENNPPRDKLRTPLYSAKVEPDLYFLGFDLSEREARGGTGANEADSAGWFFVIKERPGEPRFGFDNQSQPEIVVWNDLGWDRVPMAGSFIDPLPGAAPGIAAAVPAGEEEKQEQHRDDQHVLWNNDVSAAELAYILYQAPVMVAVHAAEMLP
jgi:hypothetical protein